MAPTQSERKKGKHAAKETRRKPWSEKDKKQIDALLGQVRPGTPALHFKKTPTFFGKSPDCVTVALKHGQVLVAVTRTDFAAFLNLQATGRDMVFGRQEDIVAELGLPMVVYQAIVRHYSKLKRHFV